MNEIREQLNNTLDIFDHPELGTPYKGKVRDVYDLGNKLLMITSDRVSAFDKVLSTIPYKGEILNRVANFWFEKTGNEIPNHVIDTPDPQVLIAKKTKPLPVEVIVRGYITGSLWRDFEKGAHTRYGIPFAKDLKRDQKFNEPIITPTTKAEYGEHDEAISREEIVNGLVDYKIYAKAEEYALKLFKSGQEWALKKGLILVDTKYEFGIVDGELILVDEVHTPDSSRYWIEEEYEERFSKGESQKMLDKENIRQWLLDRGYSGDGIAPEITDDIRIQLSERYIDLYTQLTGSNFETKTGSVEERILNNLKKAGYLK
ncbi:MAG: phosphoribosylaminoimidazolesuccinocarboxamide synthase [Candidatus Marinimicrobia bacterium]|nr:phosphoribosylaminoimidazolesuccinocarboxamide synthase [Candidatus Neomarinimicrobiota bacterium]